MANRRVPETVIDRIRLFAAYGANSVLVARLCPGYSDASIRVLARRRGIKLDDWRGKK